MTVFAAFAGVEGLGMLIPNHELVGVSEWDKFASMVLNYHYPNVRNYGDISKIDWSIVPDFDLLTGGSPCQDFSIAGKRRGLSGTRSSLAWEYIRALRDKQPKYFLWENVEGALSSRRGWDFANLLIAFSESGYSIWWQVLNAKHFGIPQSRSRVFIVGVRSDIGSPQEIFFEHKGQAESTGETIQQGFANTLTKRSAGGQNRRGNYIRQLNLSKESGGKQPYQQNRIYSPSGLSPALMTGTGGNHVPFVRVTEDGFHLARKDKKSSSIQGTHVTFPEGKSHALTTGHVPMTVSQPDEIRRLMPIECERLMGWPDDWTRWGVDADGKVVEMSDTQRYNMCGNGAVPQIAELLFKTVVDNS